MTQSNSRQNRKRKTTLVGLIMACLMALTGCVMPDGSVVSYPVTQAEPVSTSTAPAQAADDAPDVDAEPSAATPYIEAAHEFVDAGDLEAALAELDQAVAVAPEDPEAYFRRGNIHGQLGEPDAAMADLDRAIALAPDYTPAYETRAAVYEYIGDIPAAAADWRRVLELTDGGEGLGTDSLIEAYYLLAVDRYIENDLGGTVEYVEELLRVSPWDTSWFGEYASLAHVATYLDEQIAAYDAMAAEAASPGSADYAAGMQHLLRGRLLAWPEAFPAAIEAFNAAIEAEPELAAAYHARGVARILSAQYPVGGQAEYSNDGDQVTYIDPETGQSVTISRDEYDAILEEATATAETAREDGIEDMLVAVELEPTLAEAVHDLGVVHFAQQEQYMIGFVYTVPDEAGRDDALTYFDATVELAPEWPQARLSRALASVHWANQDYFAYEAMANASAIDLVFDSAGETMTVLRSDLSVEVWDVTSGVRTTTYAPPQIDDSDSYVIDAALFPDGDLLVTASDDQLVRIWNASTGEELMVLEGHEYGLEAIIVSADGTRIVSAGNDMTRLWDATTGALLLELEAGGPVTFSPDNLQLIAADEGPDVGVWDLETGERLRLLSGPVYASDDFNTSYRYYPTQIVLHQETQVVAAISHRGTLRLWRLTDEDEALVLQEPYHTETHGRLYSVSFSPDGANLVATDHDGNHVIWDVESETQFTTIDAAEPHAAVRYNTDGTTLIFSGEDGSVSRYDLAAGEVTQTLDRTSSAEEIALAESVTALANTALDDAEFLIEQDVGEGWPYYVRSMATEALARMTGDEPDETLQAQVDADWETFTQRSPNVRLDDLWVEAAAAVQLSGALPPVSPLMASSIETVDERQVLVHEPAEFSLQLPNLEVTGSVFEASVPDGPTYLVMSDEFRTYVVLRIQDELGELSAVDWLTEQWQPYEWEDPEYVDVVETPLGEVTIMTGFGATLALLPVENSVYYFEYFQSAMWSELVGSDAERDQERIIELIEGLTLLPE